MKAEKSNYMSISRHHDSEKIQYVSKKKSLFIVGKVYAVNNNSKYFEMIFMMKLRTYRIPEMLASTEFRLFHYPVSHLKT
jgi:hypothetical protein